ncbi:hypothetical protein F751_3193 [Auxenochlorella protothecoides]|uniref:Large ribosomal subunit protein mL54 n=1 Tax=Auxenochlorella protothecoides TaxID=3075 RepID=A0A087SFH1_AUXPR|nr:hypothetical protein F751_3193 [Auxenochlorella protothecoides]KFM24475.1 hypothetical protein F751_3193 [Auxenochlorella protothecoides]
MLARRALPVVTLCRLPRGEHHPVSKPTQLFPSIRVLEQAPCAPPSIYYTPCNRAAFASLSTEVATGVNILKNGTDPALKSDEELPAWLWELAQPEKPLTELQRHEFTELQPEEQRRWVKLETRAGIKANNVLKSA